MELRIGILCNGTTFRAWEAEAIRKLLAVPGVRIVVLVKNRSAQDLPQAGVLQRALRYPWRMFLYLRYRKRWFKPKAMVLEDLGTLLGTVPVVEVDVQRKGFSERFIQHDLSVIAGHHPDVLLRFGFNIIRGEILQLPRYGVWSFHHGDETKYRGGPPVFGRSCTAMASRARSFSASRTSSMVAGSFTRVGSARWTTRWWRPLIPC